MRRGLKLVAPAAAGGSVLGAVLFAACGTAGQPDQAAVAPRDATAVCQEWAAADSHRREVLEHWVRLFGGDPANSSAEPSIDSTVVRLTASPYFEVYYERLALVASGEDAALLVSYAEAWSDAVAILRDVGIDGDVIEATAAAYDDHRSLPSFTDDPAGGPLVGLLAESGTADFDERFAELPAGTAERVEQIEATLRDRCATPGG